MEVHNPAGSDLKCPTCVVEFTHLQAHKEHYKSDFHRYNLKRKMVKLSPVTFDQFKAKRVQSMPDQTSQFKCNQCGKKFASLKTLDQHALSKNHNPNAIITSTLDSNVEPTKPKKTNVFRKNNKTCVFCALEGPSFSQNLRHMQTSHSFFIPQVNYCTNPEGLVEYLQQKIEVGFLCITCQNKNAKDFNSGEAVRKHMTAKGHTFMKTDDGFDEYLDYYDFSDQFKEIVEDQKNRFVPGIEFTTLKVIVKEGDKQTEGNQDDWEDDVSQESDKKKAKKIKQGKEKEKAQSEWQSQSENEDEIGQEIKEKEAGRERRKVKTYNIMRPTHTSNDELLLPNGKILGHRKYRYLYRQTYRSPFWLSQNIKALGYEFGSNALISRENLLEIARNDKLIFNSKLRWEKRRLREGMQNNKLQIYYRSRNSV